MARVPAEQRREDFLKATLRVIAEHGVAGATTRRIAEEASAPLASLHYCFHTKQELFWAVFERQANLVAEAAGVAAGTPKEGLRTAAVRLLTRGVDFIVANEDYARAQFDLLQWAMRQQGTQSLLAADVYSLSMDRYEAVLLASMRDGEDASIVSELSRMIIAVLDGMNLQWNAHQDTARLRADTKHAITMVEALVPDLK
ncbi:MAG: TetR/AcrR family transcriptional regulator [Hamadaea sp.]|uniref:TetR/AcrR family transcriptional regulator n=1 Tax=Glycomyces artemisiae TaxID=1076443 RepID=A0A850CBF1_9ACTN|nr:TetR/AcrR family transcriptional regulator [Hamadaea sp.]NUQ88460.1 TetR/AcrR family transcriptional regulator [Glycomyces artemisiae]NUT34003.1 TetR/AcrR family transcriptional regulator [Hamadaea sp.]